MASSSATSPTVITTAPPTSSGTWLDARLDGHDQNRAPRATALISPPARKAACGPPASAISPVIGYPAPTPAAAVTERIPITAGERSGGRWSRAAAIVIGASPSPMPCIVRPTIRTGSDSATPATMPPAHTMTSPPTIASRRWGRRRGGP